MSFTWENTLRTSSWIGCAWAWRRGCSRWSWPCAQSAPSAGRGSDSGRGGPRTGWKCTTLVRGLRDYVDIAFLFCFVVRFTYNETKTDLDTYKITGRVFHIFMSKSLCWNSQINLHKYVLIPEEVVEIPNDEVCLLLWGVDSAAVIKPHGELPVVVLVLRICQIKW